MPAWVSIVLDPEGRVLHCSPGLLLATGFREDLVVGLVVFDHVVQCSPPPTAILQRFAAGEKRILGEWSLKCKNGDPIECKVVFGIVRAASFVMGVRAGLSGTDEDLITSRLGSNLCRY